MLRTLVGAASGYCLAGLSAGCGTTEKPRIGGLTRDARELIAEIAETILPETETPGAKSAGVEAFLYRVLADCCSPRDQALIIKGLNEIEMRSFSEFGRPFIQCASSQKMALIEECDREAFGLIGRIKSKIFRRTHFFRTLKELIVLGYFTSQPGATRAARYDAIPGKWIACEPLAPGQKSWATE